jgi:hypothetical protein
MPKNLKSYFYAVVFGMSAALACLNLAQAETPDESPALKEIYQEEDVISEPQSEPKEEVSQQQEETENDAPAKILTAAEFSKLEGQGLISRSSEGALGNDFWDGAARSRTLSLLQAMPANSREPAVQRLINGILLTDADTSKMLNDIEPHSGPDIFTLRLEKLMEGGAYEQALALYSKLDGKLYTPRLSESGVASLLFAGEKSLACVEAKTARDNFKDSDFLNKLSAYCNRSLQDGALFAGPEAPLPRILENILQDKNFTLAYSTKTFADLSLLERAVLSSEGRVRGSSLTVDIIKSLPPRDIQILLKASDLTPEQRLRLTIAGVSWGVLTGDDLKELYTSAMEPAAGQELALPARESLESWQRLPYYYYLASTAKTAPETWLFLRESLPLMESYGASAFVPFAEFFDKSASALADNKATPTETLQAFITADQAGKRIKPEWTLAAFEFVKNNADLSENEKDLAFLAYLSGGGSQKNIDELAEIMNNMPYSNTTHKNFSLSVIENLDKRKNHSDNPSIIYEKGFNRQLIFNASMPAPELWDALKIAEKNQIVSEVALLSTLIIGERPLQDNYPGVFTDVSGALNTVGLTRISEDFAMSALLQDTY